MEENKNFGEICKAFKERQEIQVKEISISKDRKRSNKENIKRKNYEDGKFW